MSRKFGFFRRWKSLLSKLSQKTKYQQEYRNSVSLSSIFPLISLFSIFRYIRLLAVPLPTLQKHLKSKRKNMSQQDDNKSIMTNDGEDDNISLLSLDLTDESVEARRPIDIWIDSDCLSSDESRYFTPPTTPSRVRPSYVGLREREHPTVPNSRFWYEFCSRREKERALIGIITVLASIYVAWLRSHE